MGFKIFSDGSIYRTSSGVDLIIFMGIMLFSPFILSWRWIKKYLSVRE